MKFPVLLLAGFCLASVSLAAKAMLQSDGTERFVDGNGDWYRVTSSAVTGSQSSTRFFDDSCVTLVAGCDSSSGFDFNMLVDASAASQALLDQVFISSAIALYDDNPALTRSCSDAGACPVLTPYGFNTTGDAISEVSADSGLFAVASVLMPGLDSKLGFDPGGRGITTALHAVWAEKPFVVPLPAAMPLFFFAVSLLFISRRI